LSRIGSGAASAPNPRPQQEVKDMLAVVAAILVVLWVCGFLFFKVAGGLIHILLVVAVIAVIAHFVRGRAAP
jgi:hypothetical protein